MAEQIGPYLKADAVRPCVFPSSMSSDPEVVTRPSPFVDDDDVDDGGWDPPDSFYLL